MPLDTATAKANLLSLLNDQVQSTDDQLSREQLADVLVDIVADLIRSGAVTGTVTTTGSATTQTGPITNGKIS